MQWYYQAVASRVGVRLQANQIKGDRRLGSKAAARRSPAPRRSEARCCISWRKTRARSRRGRRKSDEREHPAKITASVSIAKGMAQKALAASPNPQWTECEMQSVDEWIARQDVKLNRSEAIRRLVELGLKAKSK